MSAPQEKITRLWDKQWQSQTGDPGLIVQDRFVREAYPTYRRHVIRPDARILEAGCGTGRFCCLFGRDFPEARVTGIDVSQPALSMGAEIARKMGCSNVTFKQASLFALPYEDNSFDLVFNEGVVQLFNPANLQSPLAAVTEMTRVTKRGGRVLVSVTNWACFAHTLYKWHLRRRGRRYEYDFEISFTHLALRRLLAASGLKNIQFSGFYSAYGYYRLALHVGRHQRWIRLLGRIIDRVDRPWLSKVIGFEIVACGTKP